jgi:RNA polymerase sigma-32 factor
VPPLTKEQERVLAKRFRAGDVKAGSDIVKACLPFVVSIAVEYRRWGVPLEDIIQQGNVGLLRAAHKFDPDRECRLATYAAYWIRAEIREFVIRAFRVVRLGTTKGERKALRAYRQRQGSATVQELAEVSGLSEARIHELLPLFAGRESSLEAQIDDGPSAHDRLASQGASPEDNAAAHEFESQARDAVRSALTTLNERERFIVSERILRDDPPTLEALGSRLGVSKERVRQLEERAKSKLRIQLEGQLPLSA